MSDGSFKPRAQRLVARPDKPIAIEISLPYDLVMQTRLADVSQTGMACVVEKPAFLPEPGVRAHRVRIMLGEEVHAWTTAVVSRLERVWVASEATDTHLLALKFEQPQPQLVTSLLDHLAPSPYVLDQHAASPFSQ